VAEGIREIPGHRQLEFALELAAEQLRALLVQDQEVELTAVESVHQRHADLRVGVLMAPIVDALFEDVDGIARRVRIDRYENDSSGDQVRLFHRRFPLHGDRESNAAPENSEAVLEM
jgi:hypothetical protein